MVKISKDGSGKTRVSKGDQSGLGGQFAPDPTKIELAKKRIAEIQEITDEIVMNWSDYYPTPTFREFDSVEITVNGEYVSSDDLNPTAEGSEDEPFNSFLASELDMVLWDYQEGDIVELTIVHVPEHVEPEWVYKTLTLPQRFLTDNRKFNTEDRKTLNKMVDTVFPINIASQNTNELHIREVDGVTQLQWKTSEPLMDEENNSEKIITKMAEYNKKFQNIKATANGPLPKPYLLTFTGWYTLNKDEQKIVKRLI